MLASARARRGKGQAFEVSLGRWESSFLIPENLLTQPSGANTLCIHISTEIQSQCE